MRHRLYLHVAWTTRDREPTITAPFVAFLGRFLPTVARQERATLLAMGAVRTHLHLVVRIDPGTSLPRLLQRWKGGSSVIGSREQLGGGNPIRWARGYNIESVSPRALAAVVITSITRRSVIRTRRSPGWIAFPSSRRLRRLREGIWSSRAPVSRLKPRLGSGR